MISMEWIFIIPLKEVDILLFGLTSPVQTAIVQFRLNSVLFREISFGENLS